MWDNSIENQINIKNRLFSPSIRRSGIKINLAGKKKKKNWFLQKHKSIQDRLN